MANFVTVMYKLYITPKLPKLTVTFHGLQGMKNIHFNALNKKSLIGEKVPNREIWIT